jgi:hypothetical protein
MGCKGYQEEMQEELMLVESGPCGCLSKGRDVSECTKSHRGFVYTVTTQCILAIASQIQGCSMEILSGTLSREQNVYLQFP